MLIISPIANGSLAELRTRLRIAHEIGYIENDRYKEIDQRCEELSRMIGKLIKSRLVRSQ